MYRQQPPFSHEHRSVEILVSHHHQPLEMASNTSPGLSALLIGATGATGRLVLRHLLRSDEFSRIGEYGRRVTDRAELITEGFDESSMSKLHQKVIDFETLTDGEWAEESWNVVYITLGTSKAIAGSHEQFVKIDREYVLRAAKAARSPNVTSQKIVYLSSSGASATSWIPYLQSKGLTETALATMGYPHVIFFRPGPFKNPPREGTRRADESVGWLRNVIYSVVPSVEVPKLAKSIYVAGALGAWELHSADEDISKIFLDSKECLVVGNTGSGSLGLKYFG